uniref:Uncharacterized protein n=1 Tax=Anguilla anguilla TaxID=7936 RepID=A0A0E9RQ35_ANGAN
MSLMDGPCLWPVVWVWGGADTLVLAHRLGEALLPAHRNLKSDR